MKQLKNMQIIGIDHGYGNLKTASGIFPASVLTFDHEPVHAQDLLVYDSKYHVIGSGHREFTPDKVSNPDHYVLTLAGIGQELLILIICNSCCILGSLHSCLVCFLNSCLLVIR